MPARQLLIVEDQFIVAEQLKYILIESGYEVMAISPSAEEAEEIISLTPPDLVLLDINLAGKKDGVWLAEKLQKDFDIPFIYITSQSDTDTMERATRTKPRGYIVKPFEGAEVVETVREAVKKEN